MDYDNIGDSDDGDDHHEDQHDDQHDDGEDLRYCVWRGGVAVRTSDSQSREPGFESLCCYFEDWEGSSAHVASVRASV